MIVTEEEAKKKWCPFVRHEGDKGGSWNRTVSAMKRIFGWDGGNPYPEETCNCIASECMAWRWAHMRHFPEPANTADLYPDNQGYLARKDGNDMKRLGYCGKAGAP